MSPIDVKIIRTYTIKAVNYSFKLLCHEFNTTFFVSIHIDVSLTQGFYIKNGPNYRKKFYLIGLLE
jgi:hypothetical protein